MSRPRDFLGLYRLVRLIRVGITTEVWEAAKTDDPTRYVVKVIKRDKRNKEHISSLKNEFECGKNLKHKNIIRIYDFNSTGETTYLVMELFEHENLKLQLREGPHKVAHLALKIIEQSAEALFYFNGEGWIHRDVKPDNFLVSEAGKLKLIDFAISIKQVGGINKYLYNWFAKVQGTRSYMSPEQIRNQPLDPRSDVYSFGCVLYELVTGRAPFTGDSADDLLHRHLTAPPPSAQVLSPNVTTAFSDLIRRMMSKRKDDRPKNMWEFLKIFQTIQVFKVLPRRRKDEDSQDRPA
jgi:eukaryotic-like serine/threonine-protein kinase